MEPSDSDDDDSDFRILTMTTATSTATSHLQQQRADETKSPQPPTRMITGGGEPASNISTNDDGAGDIALRRRVREDAMTACLERAVQTHDDDMVLQQPQRTTTSASSAISRTARNKPEDDAASHRASSAVSLPLQKWNPASLSLPRWVGLPPKEENDEEA